MLNIPFKTLLSSLYIACEPLKELVLLDIPEFCGNATNFTRAVCDVSFLCTTTRGVCRDSSRRCCCRSRQTEVIDLRDLGCTSTEILPQADRINDTRCGCSVCDDIPITVIVTVVSSLDDSTITAAQIFNDDTDAYLGITIADGTFTFKEVHGTEVLQLRVQAPNFMERNMDVPISVEEPVRLVRIVLNPITIIPIGLGASALTLRLGGEAAVAAPAFAFTTSNGDVYEDLVSFNGMFADPADGDIPGLPESAGQFITSDGTAFGVTLAMFLRFVDTDMSDLSAQNLSIAVSAEPGADIFLFFYNATSGEWEMASAFTPSDISRRKRQTGDTIAIFEADNLPVNSFAVVAANLSINCWLQARTFMNDISASEVRSGVRVTLDQRSDLMGRRFLYRFGTNTGAQSPSPDFLQVHALCIPVECDNFTSATLDAQVAGVQLNPQDFDLDIFDATENPPISFGQFFFFNELRTSQDAAGEPRPFYSSEEECVLNGREIQDSAGNDRADYFAFTTTPVEPPETNEFCFIKVQVRDCFIGSIVTVRSIDPIEGNIDLTEVRIAMEGDMSMEMEMSGNFSNDTGDCTPETSTTLAVCVPFVCTDGIQVTVAQAPESELSNPCDFTSVSVLLSDNPILLARVTDDSVQIDTTILTPDDYNNPDLGLYHDPTNTQTAKERCYAGSNEGGATEIDTMIGYATMFQCGFEP